MARNKEPQIWQTILKLVVGAAAFASFVWLALWYADNYNSETLSPPLKPKADWGIVSDSPIYSRR